MIEVYLFHGMLAVQILVISILIPRRLLRRIRENLARNPPDPRGAETVARALHWYRLANIVITGIGLILMGALFSYMRRADWDDGPVEALMAGYFLLQFLPFAVLAFVGAYLNKVLRSSLQGEKRKAVLQRRGLFDFVSPVVVALTLLCYPFFVALVFAIQRNPFDGFAGPYINIALVTAIYAVTALVVFRVLYGRKSNPLQTHAERMNEIGTTVKFLIYSCLGAVVALMTNFALVLLDRQRLEPLALCIYFVVLALCIYRSMQAPVDTSPVNELHTGAAH